MSERTLIIPNVLGDDNLKIVETFNNLKLWPGFRVVRIKPKKKTKTDTFLEMEAKRNLIELNITNDNENDIEIKDENGNVEEGKNENNENSINSISTDKNNLSFGSIQKTINSLTMVEPAYYYRIKKDYLTEVPEPFILSFKKKVTLRNIENTLLSSEIKYVERIILHIDNTNENDKNKVGEEIIDEKDIDRNSDKNIAAYYKNNKNGIKNIHTKYLNNITFLDLLNNNINANMNLPNNIINSILLWSDDSVGLYKKYKYEINSYTVIPRILHHQKYELSGTIDSELAVNVIQNIRPCADILVGVRGNRSCFDKCN